MRRAFDLADRLVVDHGSQYLPALQALVRLPLEQARQDRDAGLRIGSFITGYPGSPLAGYDLQLGRSSKLLADHDVRHVPAGNEEQAATALMGTQMLDGYPHEHYDGVAGFWYGKGPGADRAGDALKHGNFAGTSRSGSVVILSGEDHEAKSSTMPFQQEWGFASAGIPILYPGSVADIRRLGLHAVALSRYSGCWVALKLVSQVCDAGETVDLGEPVSPLLPTLEIDGVPFAKRVDFSFFPGKNIDHERHLYDERHVAVLAYARRNGLNRCVTRSASDRVGIVTAGKSSIDVRQALADLGVDSEGLAGVGVRVLELGLVYPLDEDMVRGFAEGLDTIVVVEEKRDWLESGVRAALQPLGRPLVVIGKRDDRGRPLFPVHGGMDADLIAEALARVVPALARRADGSPPARLAELGAVRVREYDAGAERTPNFCSGCPHSASTTLADGQIAWGAPGCGCFNTVIEQPERHIDTMTQYGGEGLPWIGLEPFTDRPHVIQHVGDGSLYHSSYLNIRFAVDVGANMTFKVLYNGAVANTGAQAAVGSRGVVELTRGLSAEGVTKTIVVTKEPGRYRRQQLGPRTEVRKADQMLAAGRELEATKGVTVLLYDESCANERRRQQKRGRLASPTEHVVINEAVCEGCGDCGAKSNCMSLQRVETEFGPKTQIHASSCNDDYTCLQGDCPSFVTVTVKAGTGLRKPDPAAVEISDLPVPRSQGPLERPYNVVMPGVGGTGVITMNAILAVAAQLDGIATVSYDQTGAAQKWGPVLSSLILLPPGSSPLASKVGRGRADVMIALDEIGAATPRNLDSCSPDRTRLVCNTDLFPTGEMVRDVDHHVDQDGLVAALERWTLPASRVALPARELAERLLGDYLLTNMIVVGAAVQAGVLPIAPGAVDEAIRINGVSVEDNLRALTIGRQWVVDPQPLIEALRADGASAVITSDDAVAAVRRGRRPALAKLQRTLADVDPELRRLVTVRAAELVEYQSARYAGTYVDFVLEVLGRTAEFGDDGVALTRSVARNLFKLMAYKDEYEVARLFLRPEFDRGIRERFDRPVRVAYHLHPPILRGLGRDRKLRLGPWFRPVFRVLRASRRLRGTPLDPFGRLASRREERELVVWYRELVDEALRGVRLETLPLATEAADLPSAIRGYEDIKRRSARAARMRGDALLRRLHRDAGRPSLAVTQTGNG